MRLWRPLQDRAARQRSGRRARSRRQLSSRAEAGDAPAGACRTTWCGCARRWQPPSCASARWRRRRRRPRGGWRRQLLGSMRTAPAATQVLPLMMPAACMRARWRPGWSSWRGSCSCAPASCRQAGKRPRADGLMHADAPRCYPHAEHIPSTCLHACISDASACVLLWCPDT